MKLCLFSKEEMDYIHFTVLRILEKVGIKVENEEAANIYGDNGCLVKDCGGYWLVKFPQKLIEDCIRSAPSRVVFWGRERDYDFVIEPNRVGFLPLGKNLFVIDPYTKEHRLAVKSDLINWIKVINALDGLDICTSPAICSDVCPETSMLHSMEVILTYTQKPITITNLTGVDELHLMIKMCEATVGKEEFRKRPFLNISASPVTPLTLNNHTCERIRTTVEAGLIIRSTPMVLAGGTGPMTLAGTLALTVAESLSCLVLAQLVRKGAPFIFSSFSTTLDMKSGIATLGAPEHGVLAAGITKMAQYYKLPVQTGSGGSDSKRPDPQSAYEFATNTLLAALSGSNIISGAGGLDSALTTDLAKLVMDNECIANIKKALNGITVDDENLAFDIIDKAGPGGSFLDHEHTFKHFRSASQGIIFDRWPRDMWLSKGGKDTVERAYQKAKEIIEKTPQAPLLSESTQEEISGLISDYENKVKRDREIR